MKTVILAAGRGTRLSPLTDSMPKVMVEVGGQPLIERIIRQCVSVGLRDIILVVSYFQETVRNCIGDGSHLGATVTYVDQKEINGTGHAVRAAASLLSDGFMLIFGDSLVEADMIARVHNAPTAGAVGVAKVDEPSRFGIVTLDSAGCVDSIIEKPANPPSNLAVLAMYKMPYALLETLNGVGRSERGEIEIPDAVRILIDEGVKFTAVDITGVMDIANVDDLARANALKLAVA